MQEQTFAQKTALIWLDIVLNDKSDWEEIWENYLEAAYEELPITLDAFKVLMPQVVLALKNAQSLPEMEEETRGAIKQHMEDKEDTVLASEYENNKEEARVDDWTDAVVTAWTALYQRLA